MEMKKSFVINAAFYAIIAALALAAWKYMLPILMPFVIGFVVASVVQLPLHKLPLRSSRWVKPAAVGLCILFYTLLVTLIVLFFAKIITEIGNFAASVPDLVYDHLYPFVWIVGDKIQEILEPINMDLAQIVNEAGKSVASTLAKAATELSGTAVRAVASGAISIPGLLVQVIITVVSSFYIAADYELVIGFLKGLIPQAHRHYVVEVIRYARTTVLAYLKSYSILFIVTFGELWLGFTLLKVPYALGIAFAVAVFDLMPILGVGGILLPWSVIGLVMGRYRIAIGMLVLYLIICAVRNILEPRIVGRQIGIHPLATLVIMIVGLELAGLVGMLLLPITVIAILKLREGSRDPSVTHSEE